MKHVIYGLFILLFASCGIVNNNVFAKRKYTKGYFIQAKHKHYDVEVNNNNKSNKNIELAKTQNNSIHKDSISNNLNMNIVGSESRVELIKSEKKNNHIFNKQKNNSYTYEKNDCLLTNKNYFDENKIGNFLFPAATKNNNDVKNSVEFFLYLILFIVLTIVYTICIVVKAPAFPLVLAIPIAIILSLFSLLTGRWLF